MAVAVAVIDKDNAPIFVRSNETLQFEAELQLHYAIHTSLDIVDEKLSNGQATRTTDLRELYLGLLLSTEEHKLYGYATNTKVKFILMVEISCASLKDGDIRGIFRKLHNAFADAVCSPFYLPGAEMTSRKFGSVVDEVLKMGH